MRYDVHLYAHNLAERAFIGRVFAYDAPDRRLLYVSEKVEGAEWVTTLRAYSPEVFHKDLLHGKDTFRLHIREMIGFDKELIQSLMPEIYYSYKMGLYND